MKEIISTCPRTNSNKKEFEFLAKHYGLKYSEKFPQNQGFTSDEMIEQIKEASICIIGDDKIDQKVLKECLNLEYIIKWGSGTDKIDIESANKNGVEVFNTPEILGKYVAEFVLGLMIDSYRKITLNHKKMNEKIWYKSYGKSLFNRVIGFYGYGDIAKSLTKILKPFNCEIIYSDLNDLNIQGATFMSLKSVIKKSEILIVCAPLTEATMGSINKESLEHAELLELLINVSRGEIIKESEIIEMISDGSLKSLCLDVYEKEPPKLKEEVLNNGNILFTSHNASNTIDANEEVNKVILNKLDEILGD
tara:strand:- start:2283 stop:3203 length:921 start_codon:yes stop_codon:yes gene_type:complete